MKDTLVKHSLLKSIILHLLPGLLAGIFYFAITPLVKSWGYPSIMALLLAFIVLIPFELGYLLYQKRKTGQKLFNGVLQYCEHIPTSQYFIWAPIVLVLAGLLFTLLSFSNDLLHSLVAWAPSLDMGLSAEYSKEILIITYSVFFLFAVVIMPTIEELYFRGYLLPRMPDKLKGWTPIVHSTLFGLYHMWTPWMFITRAIGVLPLIYIVRHKKNIFLGIIIHILMNSIDFIVGLVFILALS